MNAKFSQERREKRLLRGRRPVLWTAIVVVASLGVALFLLSKSQDGSGVSGPLFADPANVLELAPEDSYSATVKAEDDRGIARYKLAIRSSNGIGYVVKDAAKVSCAGGCPKKGPAKNLVLDASVIPSGKSKVRVQALDTTGEAVFTRTRTVEKKLHLGIQEPRIGRPKPGSDPDDVNPHSVHGDGGFRGLGAEYFRIFVPWDRLEPSPDRFDWDADIGGGHTPPELYRSTVKDQIERAQKLGMKVIVTFQHTPCWALIREATPNTSDPCTKNEFGRRTDSNKASWPDPFRGRKPGRSMMDEYKEFVAAFVNRFSGPGVKFAERVKLYEAWNEPNNFGEAQPQICAQSHMDGERFPKFEKIPCPAGNRPGDVVSDDYYMMLYNRIFDAIYRDDVPGRPGTKFDGSIRLFPGGTADIQVAPGKEANNVDGIDFTRLVLKRMSGVDKRRCPRGPWAIHSYSDIRNQSESGVQKVALLLDGTDARTGRPIPGFNTHGCTSDLQIWITEAASLYGGKEAVGDRTASCKLHKFLSRITRSGRARDVDDKAAVAGRVDVFIQYLYQTDPGYDSGLLEQADSDGDGRLDRRATYSVFKDWSLYLQGKRERPRKTEYGSQPADCGG